LSATDTLAACEDRPSRRRIGTPANPGARTSIAFPGPHLPLRAKAAPGLRKPDISAPIQVGKYLVSPLTRPLGQGIHASSVSIKTGIGRASHDRVMRFASVFDTPQQALQFAADQGLQWLRTSVPPSPGPAFNLG
jgi:hypothetical protein